MHNISKAQIQEELESEKRFSLFSFYTQWAVYCIFFIFKLELNVFIIISGILFFIFRLLAILPKNLNPRIYLLNHLSSISILFFFTASLFSILCKTMSMSVLAQNILLILYCFIRRLILVK